MTSTTCYAWRQRKETTTRFCTLGLLLIAWLMTGCSFARLCSHHNSNIGTVVRVVEEGTSCNATMGLLYYAWHVTPNTYLYRQIDIQCYNRNHSNSWTIVQKRSSNRSSGNAAYTIPPDLLAADSTTSCIVRGCYNVFSDPTEYLTNNVTVDCLQPDAVTDTSVYHYITATTTMLPGPRTVSVTGPELQEGTSISSEPAVLSSVLPGRGQQESSRPTLLLILLPATAVLFLIIVVIIARLVCYTRRISNMDSIFMDFVTDTELDRTMMPSLKTPFPSTHTICEEEKSRDQIQSKVEILSVPDSPSPSSVSCGSEHAGLHHQLASDCMESIESVLESNREHCSKPEHFNFKEASGESDGVRDEEEEEKGEDCQTENAMSSHFLFRDIPTSHPAASSGTQSSQQYLQFQTSSGYVTDKSNLTFPTVSHDSTTFHQLENAFQQQQSISSHPLLSDEFQTLPCVGCDVVGVPNSISVELAPSNLKDLPADDSISQTSPMRNKFNECTEASSQLCGISNPLFDVEYSPEPIEKELPLEKQEDSSVIPEVSMILQLAMSNTDHVNPIPTDTQQEEVLQSVLIWASSDSSYIQDHNWSGGTTETSTTGSETCSAGYFTMGGHAPQL